MDIQLPGHKARRQRILPIWKKMAELINAGRPVSLVAKEFTNPQTRKPYSKSAIYYILKQLEGGDKNVK